MLVKEKYIIKKMTEKGNKLMFEDSIIQRKNRRRETKDLGAFGNQLKKTGRGLQG